MSVVIEGYVKDGLVLPASPLPEGSRVEIRVAEAPKEDEAAQSLEADFDAWNRASDKALELVEEEAKNP